MRIARNVIFILSSLVLFSWSGMNMIVAEEGGLYDMGVYGDNLFVSHLILLFGFMLLLFSAIFTACIRKGN